MDNSKLKLEGVTFRYGLADGIARGGDKTFAIYRRADGSTEYVSYNEIKAEGEALMEKLRASGLKKGDRLGVITTMRPWWYSILYAALFGEYVLVTIDPGIPVKQTESMLRQTQVRTVFTMRPAEKLPASLEGHIPVYAVEKGFPIKNGVEKVDSLLPEAERLPEDCFFILFSSGTTGEKRKAAMLTPENVVGILPYATSTSCGVFRNQAAYNVHKRDMSVFPPYHIAGLLVAFYDIYGNTEMIMFERLNPAALVSAIAELKPDCISVVPSLLTTLMKKIQASISDQPVKKLLVNSLLGLCGFMRKNFGWNLGRKMLKFLNKKAFGGNLVEFRIGGSPCDEATMRFFLNMGIDVNLAYGLTELGAPLAATGRGYYPGSTGKVLRHRDDLDIRIVNPDEQGRGEVEVLSPVRMISYMDEAQMEGCLTEDNYFKTGDLGYFDERGCLVICGRSKEAIVMRNGEKRLPEEIEAHYQNITGVAELSVFRVPDTGGCDTFSIAATKENKGLPDEVIRLHIANRVSELPNMYSPREIYILRELPLSSTRKVQRFRLTEMALRGENEPVSEASLRHVDEDGVASELREILVNVGGSQWKSVELTEGLTLGLESLQAMDMYVEVQERFGLDLMQLEKLPETFGELLEAVSNFEEQSKREKESLDLNQFPRPVKLPGKILAASVEKAVNVGYGVKSSGMENIPSEGNYLICSNHRTVLDPVWICASMTQTQRTNTAIVGKAEVMYDKLLKNVVRLQNIVPVDRTGNSMATLNRCRELLEEGWNVLIFPEGTNYENAETLMPFKDGPARLAAATKLPIVPVHIKGVKHKDSNDTSFLPHRGKNTEVVFGKPIYPGDMSVAEINEALRKAIEAL